VEHEEAHRVGRAQHLLDAVMQGAGDAARKIGLNGRDIAWKTMVAEVAEEKAHNIHAGGGRSRDEFIAYRTSRDAVLAMPRPITPSYKSTFARAKCRPTATGTRC